MKMRFSFLPVLLVAAFVTAITAAMPPVPAEEEPHSVTFAASISLDEAVKMAEQRFKARVVRAEAQQDGDNTIYVLRMLNESGRVWTVRVDATNGAVL
jgi:uncharacterized membrane protein YkoI